MDYIAQTNECYDFEEITYKLQQPKQNKVTRFEIHPEKDPKRMKAPWRTCSTYKKPNHHERNLLKQAGQLEKEQEQPQTTWIVWNKINKQKRHKHIWNIKKTCDNSRSQPENNQEHPTK